MRALLLAYVWLWGVNLWTVPHWNEHTGGTTAPTSVVMGQPYDDDSIDDKFFIDDGEPDDWPFEDCALEGFKGRGGKGQPASKNFLIALLLLGVFLHPYCMITDAEYRRVQRLERVRLRCLLGLRFQRNGLCICNERQLRRAIQDSRNASLCFGVDIKLSSEIDITNKSFNISCTERRYAECTIRGSGSSGLFKGSPKHAIFHELDFRQGSANEGGVALLTGGRTQFTSCEVRGNNATAGNGGALSITNGSRVELMHTHLEDNVAINGNGGAISITGPGSTLMYDRISMRDNRAMNGGAMYVANGAKVTSPTFFWHISDHVVSQLGGAIYVDHASIFLKGSMYRNRDRFDPDQWSGILSNVWIADDDDPSLLGSNVSCGIPKSTSKMNRTRSGYCGLGEFAGGKASGSGVVGNRTQLFPNTNCLLLERPLLGSNSPVLCWKNGTCIPNVRALVPCN